MKILVISDTHKMFDKFENLLDKYADEVKMVCHLGDYAEDLTKFKSQYPQLTFVAVAGNSDKNPDAPPEVILQISACMDDPTAPQKRILMVHGHDQSVKSDLLRLLRYAKEKAVDAVFFGHTHIALCNTTDGIFLMNPGSPICPHPPSNASYGLVEISPEGEISGELLRP